MKSILITSHVWRSPRKAGFHWIGSELSKKGHQVIFLCGLSLVDILKNDYRTKYMNKSGKNKLIYEEENIFSYYLYNLIRPFNIKNKYLDKLFSILFINYGKKIKPELYEEVKNADLFIFESVNEIMFFNFFKKINPNAQYIYRVSDNMSIKNTHELVLNTENQVVRRFDLVSVPNKSIYEHFNPLNNLVMQPHGIPESLYNLDHKSPYTKLVNKNAIFIGSNFLDKNFLDIAIKEFPSVNFHIIGPVNYTSKYDNVHIYGEMEYIDTIPFVKHADIALSPMILPSFTDSNKIKQYNFCKLPVVISSINKSDNKNFFYYDLGNEASICDSINKALNFNPSSIVFSKVSSWESVVQNMLSTKG